MNNQSKSGGIFATVLGLMIFGAANAHAQDAVPEETALEENVAEELESVATMSIEDLSALFTALTDGFSSPLIDDIRDALQNAADDSKFSGSNEDGTQTWSGEVKYYPFLSIFDAQVTVNAIDYVVDDVDDLALNGSMTIRIAGFWNPIYNGLTSLGFPYITYFLIDGEMASTGFVEEQLSVHLLIDGTTDPLQVEFVINGNDIMAALQAAAEEADAEPAE